MRARLEKCLATGLLCLIAAIGHLNAATLSLDQNFRAPLFSQPSPPARVLLLPDGKYLLFFNTNTLANQRTGPVTRYFEDGTLDSSFNFPREYVDASAAAVTGNGQLIVAVTRRTYGAAQTELVRVNADGSLDPTFSASLVAADVASANVRAITIQPDGRILVAGLFNTFAGLNRQKIVRLFSYGGLDTSFTPPQFDPNALGIYTRPVLLSDGKTLIAGDFTQVNGGSSLSVARLNSNGSLDSTFQAAGFNRVSGNPVRGMVVQADGKIVIAARFQFGTGSTVTRAPLYRLMSNGSADLSFTHVTSVLTAPGAKDLAAQPDGKLIVATGRSFYRFASDGALDTTFASPTLTDDSYQLFDFTGSPVTINVRLDGRILIGGAFTDVNPSERRLDAHFGVARLKNDGTLDPTLITSHKTAFESPPTSFARLDDGAVLAAFSNPDVRIEPATSFRLARLRADGSFDSNFSLSSSNPASILKPGFLALTLDRLRDGKFLVSGTSYDAATDVEQAGVIGKFLPNGEEDTAFISSHSLPIFDKVIPLANGKALLAAGNSADSVLSGLITGLTVDGRVDLSFHLAESVSSAQVVRNQDSTLEQLALGSYVLAVQADGKILYSYLSALDRLFHLVRLNPDGSIDNTFTASTIAAPDLAQTFPYLYDPLTDSVVSPASGVWTASPAIRSALIQDDGRIILAGQFTSFSSMAMRGIVRLQPDGAVDASFGSGGGAQWTHTTETSSYFPFVEDMAGQVDGKILIAGTFEAFNGVVLPGIASLRSDGSSDPALLPPVQRNRYSLGVARLARQPDGSFLLSGPYSFPNESDPAFIHINNTGGAPVLGSPTLATAVAGQTFRYQIVASGQPTGYHASGLPTGLTLDSATGLITGTTDSVGAFVVTLTATNIEGTSAAYQVTFTVTEPPPVVTSSTSVTAYVGQMFTYQITASHQPTSFRAEGLPDGFTIDEASGVIGGTSSYAGASSVTVHALNAAGAGHAVVALTMQAAPLPSNDNFAGAQGISGFTGSETANNSAATIESGEPRHNDEPGGKSLWYSWTAPATGNFIFDTTDSSFSTLLAVYSGSSLTNLVAVATYWHFISPTRFQFTASVGVTYKIAVDGHNSASGSVKLNWRPGAELYGFATLAGNPPGDADGPGTNARFQSPYDAAVDGNGNVYVADRSSCVIRRITSAGIVSTFAGSPGTSGVADGTGVSARFGHPHGLATDNAGNVYVADTLNHLIRKISPAAVVSTLAGSGTTDSNDGTGSAASFYTPEDIAADSSGNIYVADTYNQTIRKITPAGVVTTLAGFAGTSGSADGTGSNARFYYPAGVAVDQAGNIYVADTRNYTIRKVTPGGVVTTIAGLAGSSSYQDGNGSNARFSSPQHLTIDASGNLYVADAHAIRRVTPAGVVTTFVGSSFQIGSSDGNVNTARFYQPMGVTADAVGNLYVADTYNFTVRKVTPIQEVSTLAGLASPGSSDGVPPAARLFSSWGCAIDSLGNLFIADTYNHTIRKKTPGGAVTTFAGLAGVPGAGDGAGSAARFAYPTDVACGPDGSVYVADYSSAIIRKITSQGVVSTIAGSAYSTGTANGQGSVARFSNMYGLAVDQQSNVYVADTGSNTIRKITPSGLVSTFAGAAGVSGGSDGTSGARFSKPQGVAADAAGNVYVADTGNETIRKITPAGVVSTLAGSTLSYGIADGVGSAARFRIPRGIAIDANGTLFVTDDISLRKIAPNGTVTTIGGHTWSSGSKEGLGSYARFNFANGLAVDASGKIYIADTSNHAIRVARPVPLAPVAISSLTNAHKMLSGTVQPNAEVQIMATENLTLPFGLLATVLADVNGIYDFEDVQSDVIKSRCYRLAFPGPARAVRSAVRFK